MANHKSALKRARQNDVKRVRNKAAKTRVRSAVKEIRSAVAENQVEKVAQAFPSVVSTIQRTASKGTIHKRNAARKVSRLARQINKATAPR
ncbi:MAG: 30S ribosomal protein S20 [Desulfobacteraceae bacterium]|nr:MAG: 30S ribosomal protein S20 [Desulfobacteraceae bacterium]